jgi:hypothetical protein
VGFALFNPIQLEIINFSCGSRSRGQKRDESRDDRTRHPNDHKDEESTLKLHVARPPRTSAHHC